MIEWQVTDTETWRRIEEDELVGFAEEERDP